MVQPPPERKEMDSVDASDDMSCASCHCKCSMQEVLALRREVQQLRSELVEARTGISTNLAHNQWSDHPLERNSEVYCSSFAASAWAAEGHEGVRLFINQNNTLTELIASPSITPNHDAIVSWNRCFVSPVPLMSNSAIAAVNSYWPKSLVPDSEPTRDRGRNIQRVFYFDVHGVLREWICQAPIYWQASTLAIADADPKCLSAISWAEGEHAMWSLFYMTKEEFVDGECRGGRLLEVRCIGGATGKWSRATDVGWAHERRSTKEPAINDSQATLALQSRFSATTNADGTDRRIFYLNPASDEPNPPFQALKWGGRTHNGWITEALPVSEMPYAPPGNVTTSFSPLYTRDGIFGIIMYLQDGNHIKEWSSPSGVDGRWIMKEICSNNSTPNAVVAAVDLWKGNQYRLSAFSLVDGKIVQTTYIRGFGWSVRPITIGSI